MKNVFPNNPTCSICSHIPAQKDVEILHTDERIVRISVETARERIADNLRQLKGFDRRDAYQEEIELLEQEQRLF